MTMMQDYARDDLHQVQEGAGSPFGAAPLPDGWTVHVTPDLPDDMDGATRWSDRTVWIRDNLRGHALRFILEHERQHARRGPARGWSQDLEERLCDRLAAKAMWAQGLLVDADWLV